jgi:hypothetical protein
MLLAKTIKYVLASSLHRSITIIIRHVSLTSTQHYILAIIHDRLIIVSFAVSWKITATLSQVLEIVSAPLSASLSPSYVRLLTYPTCTLCMENITV